MVLKGLNLVNFRNFAQKKFQFSPGATLIYGGNATGKSNLLEAVYLLASGGSLRAGRTVELIREGETFTRIEGRLSAGEAEPRKLEIILEKESGSEGSRALKRFRMNGVPRPRRDFVGNFRAVLFSPEQLNLVSNGPAYRRNYLDLILSQVDKNYFVAISAYNKARINRNKVLYQISSGSGRTSELSCWDDLLVENGLVVGERRKHYIDYVNGELIGNRQGLWGEGWCLQLLYQRNPLSHARLAEFQAGEIAAGETLIGPHREDIIFFKTPLDAGTGGTDLHRYGSRGEQRLAVVALKLAEGEFLAKDGDKPLLLLDDIFSELDESHRQLIFRTLGQEQTLVTTAEARVVSGLIPKDWPVLSLAP